MKTQIRIACLNAYAPEKIEPSFSGALWADIGFRYASTLKLTEKRNQFMMEPGYVVLAALSPENYQPSLYVNIPHRVKISFGKPATLIPRNLEAVSQKSSHRLWLLNDLLSNERGFFGGKRGFDFAGKSLEPKLTAWIGWSVASEHSLFHDEAQCFNFENGSVVPRSVRATPTILPLSPFNITLAIFSTELPWNENFPLAQEQAEAPPRDPIAEFTLELVAVAFVEESWYPCEPSLLCGDGSESFLIKRPLVNEVAGSAGLSDVAMPQPGGFIPDLSNFTPVANPPVRGTSAFVEGSHVSTSVNP